MLKKVYPQYKWLPWKFKALPKITYRDQAVVREALEYIEAKCEITKPEDWYRISRAQLLELGVESIISQNGGLYEVLKVSRPNFAWAEENFILIRSSGLKTLGIYLRKLWPQLEIVHNHVLFDQSSVSYFIPSLKLALDFQSSREYLSMAKKENSLLQVIIPQEKKEFANKSGVAIVFVPFWWDRTLPSLVSTILESNPSLKSTMSNISELTLTSPIPNRAMVNLSSWRKRL